MSCIRRIWNLFCRSRMQQEIETELRCHMEMRIEDSLASGMSLEEARRDARLRFGNPVATRERIVAIDAALLLENVVLDLRYAIRQLRRSPGFAAVAVLTLAMGIGVNTAIFTFIHAVILQTLPVTKPQELFSLSDGESRGETGALQGKFRLYSYPLYRELRDHTPEFEQLAAYQSSQGNIMSVRRPNQLLPDQFFTELVSGNYFSTLGVHAWEGRTLEPGDDQPGAAPVAVMSYPVWQNSFHSDPQVVGTTLYMDGHPVTVIGVMPRAFFGDALSQNATGLWLPLSLEPLFLQQGSLLQRWNTHWLMVMGRLHPGVRPPAVQAKLTNELQNWVRQQPLFERQRESLPRQHIEVIPASGGISVLRQAYARRLKLLMTFSGLVLLIACANVANMLMAKSASQRRQVAVQMALGASRARLIQQTVIQALVLAFLGGTGALGISFLTVRGILLLAFRGTNAIPINPGLSLPVLAFALLISLLTAFVFSVAPAQLAARTQPADPLRSSTRSIRDGWSLPQRVLVVSQAALSLVLLVATGLLLKSVHNLQQQHFGFETDGRLIAGLAKPVDQYKPEQLEGFYRNLQHRLESIPGVMTASFADFSPMNGNGAGEPVTIPGVARAPQLAGGSWPDVNHVSTDYFATVGTKILRGRAIDDHDTPKSQHVAVIDQAFANLYFPGQDPIGKHFGILEAARSGDYEIVGIAENAKYGNPHAAPYPTFFLAFLQNETYEDTAENSEQLGQNYLGSIQLRVSGSPANYEEQVRRALAELNPNLTISYVRSFADEVGLNLTQDVLFSRLMLLYGLLSLLLCAIGLYGVLSYAVVHRTNEIGIRMALGADRMSVVRMIIRGALRLTVIGLLVGGPSALLSARVIRNQLFGVSAADPTILTLGISVLVLASIIAAYVPARRASRIEPMQALRDE